MDYDANMMSFYVMCVIHSVSYLAVGVIAIKVALWGYSHY